MDEDDAPYKPNRPKKNTYKFYMGNNVHREVVISSNFDSGNIELVRQVNEFYYRLAAVPDSVTPFRPKKTWFHFRVRAYRNCRLKFVVENIDILLPAYEWSSETCRPVYKVGEQGTWSPLPPRQGFLSRRQQLQLHIEHTFQSDQSVFFALSIPFSYENNFLMLEELEKQIPTESQTYFKKEIMTYSLNKLMVHLLTISEKEPNQPEVKEKMFDSNLFPQNDRALRFDKPVVLISSRVHPGEVGSSHTLVGILKFLLNQNDLRAYLLRRLFVFMVVPMLNPDGVFQGHYRMDTLSRNLNRLFTNPDFSTQPQIYALRKLTQHLSSESRLFFYLDMHGHSSTKPAFVYGNALDDIINQVESQLYCKALSLNTKYFSYEYSNFTEEQMSAKDSNEPFTKEGCSRVCLSRISNIPHCLTLEVGLHPTARNWEVAEVENGGFVGVGGLGYVERAAPQNMMEVCYEIGEETMITILDLVEKNPYSRLQGSQYKDIGSLRRSIAALMLQEDDRFRKLDVKAYQKVKMIDKHAQQYFTDKYLQRWSYLINDQKFIKYDWPIQGLKALANLKPLPPKSPRKQKSPNRKRTRLDSLTKQQVINPTLAIKQILDCETTDTCKQKICAFSLNVTNSKIGSPSEFDTGLTEEGEKSHREAIPTYITQQILQQFKKELRNRQLELDKPILIVKELELPKIFKNMIDSSDSQQKIIAKRKTTSCSPNKKPQLLKKDVDSPSFLLGMETGAVLALQKVGAGSSLDRQHLKRDHKSKRKLSILQSLKRVQAQSQAMFEKANRQGLEQYSAEQAKGITKRTEGRIKTQIMAEQISKSHKNSRRQLTTTQPNVIQQFLHKENERYERMIAQQQVQQQKVRNIRQSKRQLVNIKLRQFRKKVQQPRKPMLPQLKRSEDANDNQNEEFDDLGIRDTREHREIETHSYKEVKLYISSKRMAPAKLT